MAKRRLRPGACFIAVFYNKADGVYNYFNKERNEWCEYKREEIRLKQMKISTAAVSNAVLIHLYRTCACAHTVTRDAGHRI